MLFPPAYPGQGGRQSREEDLENEGIWSAQEMGDGKKCLLCRFLLGGRVIFLYQKRKHAHQKLNKFTELRGKGKRTLKGRLDLRVK